MGAAGRAGTAVAGAAALGASFLLGVVAAGGAGPATTSPPTTAPPLRLAGALTTPGSCDALLASYVERGTERVGPWGWDLPVYAAMEGDLGEDAGASEPMEEAAPASGSRVVEQGSSATGTNVQEVGVDEPDVVKTDGELLLRVQGDDLLAYDVTGEEPVELSDTDLPSGLEGAELLLSDGTAVVTGTDASGGTRVLTYDVTTPTAPLLVDHRGFDTALVRAVQHDDVVRLVLGTGLPDLDFVEPRFWRDEDDAREDNQDVVRESSIDDWLPTVTTYDAAGVETGSERLLDCEQVTVPQDEAPLGTTAVVGFDTDDPADLSPLGVAADTDLVYASQSRLYVATTAQSAWTCCPDVAVQPPVDGRWVRPVPPTPDPADDGRSHVHAFALTGDATSYVASGVVDGVVADRWAMDEHDGVLRLAVGPTPTSGLANAVVTMREDGDELEEVGRVGDLGPGEDIKSVRWFDDLAIVVTFRQVDPLYPVDLADPDAPRLLGELKIPGFSEYLHPISGQRLIGMGQDADTGGALLGAQAALFDVSDLTAPRQTDVVRYRPGSTAAAGTDPRQFTWLPGRDTALTVVGRGWQGPVGWVSVLEVSGGSLRNRMVDITDGTALTDVRLVPLPDERVVLVTAYDVEFLDL